MFYLHLSIAAYLIENHIHTKPQHIVNTPVINDLFQDIFGPDTESV